LLTVGESGEIRLWDLENGKSREIRPCKVGSSSLDVSSDGGDALVLSGYSDTRVSTLGVLDLETESIREIASHGNRITAAAFDPSGKIVVTGDRDGVVRVGPVTGEEPHLLFGHTLEVSSVAVSRDGQWIASGSQDGTIRLWPMPEGTPFHTLPHAEILERIRGLTNLRVIPDESSETGYRVEIGPFPGWKKLPE
jgi:WD40 repeat protein